MFECMSECMHDEKCAGEVVFIFIITMITLVKIGKAYQKLEWAWSNEYVDKTSVYVNTMFLMVVIMTVFIMWVEYNLLAASGVNTGLMIVFVKIPKSLVKGYIEYPVKKYFRRHEHCE